MPHSLLTTVTYGEYISIVKLVIFLLLFFLWIPVVRWVYTDAEAVGSRQSAWAGAVFAAGAVGIILWTLIPVFIIGLILFVLVTGSVSLGYLKHRDARVLENDRILTADFVSNLFSNKEKKLDELKSFVFVTANGNEVPLPEPRTREFQGYQTSQEVFSDALRRRAEEVAFVHTQKDCQVAYQIDGVAVKRPPMSKEQMEYFTPFVKQVADLDIQEKRKPQKNKFEVRRGEESTEWEIMTSGSTAGEQIRLRQIKEQQITQISELGLSERQEQQLRRTIESNQGVFIISGPPKSGVTTTFYTLLRSHDAFINNINTLERDTSAELPNITQNIYNPGEGESVSYAGKLQQIVRMSPEIVGVAGCNDAESARTICNSARNKELMYVTLSAESVMKALEKWLKLVGNKKLVFETLLGISNQRLIRILCPECKQAYAPNRELLRKFGLPPDKAKVLHRAGGEKYDKRNRAYTCEKCQGTGFFGRMGVFELITIDESLREELKKCESLSDIGSQFRAAKMRYIQEEALKNVVAGTTSINEMVRALKKSGNKKNNSRK